MKILLLIHDDAGQEARLAVAFALARALDGRLICLDVAIMRVLPGDGFGADGGLILYQDECAREAANRAVLEKRLAEQGLSWEWIEVGGSLERCLAEAADRCDLIVVNRTLDGFAFPDMRGVAGALILGTGKPLLAVPPEARPFRADGAALVAWNGSRAAEAALRSALPLLRHAGTITVLEIDDGSLKAPGEAAIDILSAHGLRATVIREQAPDAAEALLARARSGAHDYLVMGGFGHSRLRETLFGGVTRRLLHESPIPLFIAH